MATKTLIIYEYMLYNAANEFYIKSDDGMRNKIYLIVSMLFVFTLYSRDINAQNSSVPVVVELFTSQGCPSCPPADKIFSEMARNENVIALGCHVTYWDRPYLKDELAQDFCDIRQHGYIGMKGEKRFYTPQIIVNGGDAFVGSRDDKLKNAVISAQNNPIKIIDIGVDLKNNIVFSLPSVKSGSYRLWAYGYKNYISQNIGGGKNNIRSINYANPVMSYTNLGSWNGVAVTRNFNMPDAQIDGIAILAQEGGYGKIVAAGKLALLK